MLAWTIYISFAGALVLALLPKGNAAGGAMVLRSRWRWRDSRLRLSASRRRRAGTRDLVDVPWVPSMGIHYTLAADGISRVLVLLTGWRLSRACYLPGTSSIGRTSFSLSFSR